MSITTKAATHAAQWWLLWISRHLIRVLAFDLIVLIRGKICSFPIAPFVPSLCAYYWNSMVEVPLILCDRCSDHLSHSTLSIFWPYLSEKVYRGICGISQISCQLWLIHVSYSTSTAASPIVRKPHICYNLQRDPNSHKWVSLSAHRSDMTIRHAPCSQCNVAGDLHLCCISKGCNQTHFQHHQGYRNSGSISIAPQPF